MNAPRIEIVGGGQPDPAELAALVLALTPVTGPADDRVRSVERTPAWRRAALLEGVGGAAPVVSASDLSGSHLR